MEVRTQPRRIDLFRQDGELFVRGGWPDETRLSYGFVEEFHRADAADLIEIRAVNGRAIYRIRLEVGFVFRAVLVYQELESVLDGNI